MSLLTLFVEKYGSCLSFGESDIALIDMARSTAAVACAIAPNLESENICLVAGDLSGIQKFIYTISSDGALKSLRARSFYLELVAEEIVQQLLDQLKLPRIQNQIIKDIEDKRKHEKYSDKLRDIRYYLHLPKVAYTLARLPKQVLDDEDFRKSLKSPYNAPYFQAIATWIELLNRQQNQE